MDGDATRLLRAWSTAPAQVTRDSPELFERGQLTPLRFTRSETDARTDDCVTVAVIGVASAQFVLRVLPAAAADQSMTPSQPSAAGAAQVVRCGLHKAELPRLAIEMRSPRGVLEVVRARSRRPVPFLTEILPHRDPGPSVPLGRVGPRPNASPVATRSRGFALDAKRRGAEQVARAELGASAGGGARLRLRLAPGCHELRVLPDNPVSDVDAELWRVPQNELLASDRAPSTDASLEACVAEPTNCELRVGAATHARNFTVMHAHWPLPRGILANWGATARGRLAATLTPTGLPLAQEPPVDQALLPSGVSVLGVGVAPGRCYLAAVAPVRGRGAGVALSTTTAFGRHQNQSGPDGLGATLGFCASDVTARIDVEARGAGSTFLFAMWAAGGTGLQ